MPMPARAACGWGPRPTRRSAAWRWWTSAPGTSTPAVPPAGPPPWTPPRAPRWRTRSTRCCAGTGPTSSSGDTMRRAAGSWWCRRSRARARTCVGGVVLDDGRPVGDGADARGEVGSSRPAEHLRAAGAAGVAEVGGADALARWLAAVEGAPFAVCDAATDADLAAVAAAWSSHRDVLIAGTAATVAAAAAPFAAGGAPAAPPPLAPSILVVCGSLHRVARRQVAHLGALGVAVAEPGSFLGTATGALEAGRPAVVASPAAKVQPVEPAAAEEMAEELAATARALTDAAPVGTLVVVGGDTAAAVLGPGAAARRRHAGAGHAVGPARRRRRAAGRHPRRQLRRPAAPWPSWCGGRLEPMSDRPMAITMGDASGVGPGDRAAPGAPSGASRRRRRGLRRRRDPPPRRRAARARRRRAHGRGPARCARRRLNVVDLGRLAAADHRPGELDAASGAAARDYVLPGHRRRPRRHGRRRS